VALIGKVAAQASTLISQGVSINSWPPQYFYNDLNAVKVRLIGAATRDAQLRAEQFAAGSGVTVGPLRSASQGVFQITRPNSTETATTAVTTPPRSRSGEGRGHCRVLGGTSVASRASVARTAQPMRRQRRLISGMTIASAA